MQYTKIYLLGTSLPMSCYEINKQNYLGNGHPVINPPSS